MNKIRYNATKQLTLRSSKMWTYLAHIILRNRLLLMILIGVVTLLMGYQAQNLKWSYSLQNIVPDDDQEMIYFNEFRQTYGEDGNLMIFAFDDSSIYELQGFRHLTYLTNHLKTIEGVEEVIGLANLNIFLANRNQKKFEMIPLFPEVPTTQEDLDSLLKIAINQRLYDKQLFNTQTGVSLLLVSINAEVLNSKKRDVVVPDVIRAAQQYENETGVDLKYTGLPYVRYVNRTKVQSELNLFLGLSVAITGLILFLFFRSFKAVLFPLIIIGVIIVWVLGTISILGYEITLLTGLIPPIIVIIGIPNSVYMLNKYHHEYLAHGDKMLALSRIIRKIGIVTLITNVTTAIGFFVLMSTQIRVLVEFGLVAGINILATFLVSIILIPSVFSYVDTPSAKHLKHLKFKTLDWVLSFLDMLVHQRKALIFSLTSAVVLISLYGASRIETISYMLDDMPQKSEVIQDMRFLDQHFGGIMPFEFVIDTGQKRGVENLSNLRKIQEIEVMLDSMSGISKPLSPLNFIKASRQAYYNGNSGFYGLPTNRDRAFISRYLQNNQENKEMLRSFVDSTGQKVRMSVKMSDIGSVKMDSLVHKVVKPQLKSTFANTNMSANITGTTYMYVKGNEFLVRNLIISMIIAFILISFIMGTLFRNMKMIFISLVPNMIPLIITAGIMGFFWHSIETKHSTCF